MDYVSLLEGSSSSLDEVDFNLFSDPILKTETCTYIDWISKTSMTIAAIRLAIATVTENYVCNHPDISRRIFLCLMFIYCASSIFSSNLRQHLFRISEHYRGFPKSYCIITSWDWNRPQWINFLYIVQSKLMNVDGWAEI